MHSWSLEQPAPATLDWLQPRIDTETINAAIKPRPSDDDIIRKLLKPECVEILPVPSEAAQWSPDGCALEAELGERAGQFSAIFRGFALAILAHRDGGLHHGLYRVGLTSRDLHPEGDGADASPFRGRRGAHPARQRCRAPVKLESN